MQQLQQPRQYACVSLNPLQQMQQTRPARQIKEQPFCWQGLTALDVVRMNYDGHRLGVALLLYNGLTEIASRQRTPDKAKTSCHYLGQQVGLSETTARRYLHDFAKLGLIAVEAGTHTANTYILLPAAQPPPPEVEGDVLLVDTIGISQGVNRTIPLYQAAGATPKPLRGSTRATLEPSRGSSRDSQCITTEDNKGLIQQQTNIAGGDGTMVVEAERLEPVASVERPSTPPQEAVNALCQMGIRRATAEQLAVQHNIERVVGWADYARNAIGLNNRAGFVISRLKAGDPAPLPADRFSCYIVGGTVPPLARKGVGQSGSVWGSHSGPLFQPPSSPALPPLEIRPPLRVEQARDVWRYSASDEMRRAVGQVVWLRHFARARLVAVAGSDWLLADTEGQTADTYRQQLEEVLRRATKQPITLRYV